MESLSSIILAINKSYQLNRKVGGLILTGYIYVLRYDMIMVVEYLLHVVILPHLISKVFF